MLNYCCFKLPNLILLTMFGQIYIFYNITNVLPLLPHLCFVLACHCGLNVYPGFSQSAINPHSIRDAGLHPLIVQRPLEGCQSCLIIVSVNLICASEDKVWPLLQVIVWLTCLIHDPTAESTGESNSCQMSQNCLSVLKYSISVSPLRTLLLFPPFHPGSGVKIQIYVSWEMTPSVGVWSWWLCFGMGW